MKKGEEKMEKITVIKDKENPESVEIIADAIIKVAEAFKRINQSRLTRKAIVCLIYEAIPLTSTGYGSSKRVGKGDIGLVLDYAEKLKEIYIKKPAKK